MKKNSGPYFVVLFKSFNITQFCGVISALCSKVKAKSKACLQSIFRVYIKIAIQMDG